MEGRGAKRPVLEIASSDEEDDLGMDIDAASLNSSQTRHPLEPNLEVKELLGHIERVQLINFMCHSNFIYEPSPYINFITGQNGSGKSAILTGLIFVFGARASITDRGKQVKNFIKRGEEKARVIVKICNFNGQREFSYDYDIYGKSIIVERTITVAGTSTYSIKNSNGHVVSTTKSELEKITNHFNIQVDNPVVILNQEVSRNFLNSRNAEDKYHFFFRASNLEALCYRMRTMKEHLDDAKRTKREKEQMLKVTQSEFEKLRKEVKKFNQLKLLKDQIAKLEKELIWTEVIAKEKQLADKKEEFAAEMEKLSHLKDMEQGSEGRAQNLKDELSDVEKKLTEHQEKLEEVLSKVDEETDRVTTLKTQSRRYTEDIRQQKQEVETIQRSIDNYNKTIEKERQKLGDQAKLEDERRKRIDKIQKLETRIKEIESEVKTLTEQLIDIKKNQEEKLKRKQVLARERHQFQRANQDHQNRIRELEASKGNNLRIFGQFIPDVNEAIERAFTQGRFKVKPIGPVGRYISLKDPSISTALQASLKQLTHAYVCDNFEDSKVLNEILKCTIRSGRKPQVITRKFHSQKFDVSRNKVCHEKYSSLIDLINVSDPNAFNAIVDRCRLETVAYIRDTNEAMEVLLNIRTVPTNCFQAYSQDGTLFYPTTTHKTFRMYPNEFEGRVTNIFSLDVASEIRQLKSEISKNNAAIEGIEDEIRKVENHEACKTEITDVEESIKKLKLDKIKLQSEHSSLKNFSEAEPTVISSLETDRDEQLARLEEEEAKLEAIKGQLQDINQKVTETKKEIEDLHEMQQELKQKIKLTEKRRGELQDEIRKLDSSRNHRKLRSQEEKVDQLKDNVQEIEERVTALTDNALKETGDRFETDKTSNQIKPLIREKKALLEESDVNPEQEGEVRQKYDQAKKQLDDIQSVIDVVEKCTIKYEDSFKKRRELFYDRLVRITQDTKDKFKRCLNQLGFEGYLDIEHTSKSQNKKARLEIRVNPKAGTGGQLCKDTRSLSGGERSFSTVAFLLALWEGCNSPFRILDEVDVFMDMVTRQVSMDTMIQAAEESGRQHIFLSPLPIIENHVNKENVRIHRMPEPVRVGVGVGEGDNSS